MNDSNVAQTFVQPMALAKYNNRLPKTNVGLMT